jgi:hypothetical protein
LAAACTRKDLAASTFTLKPAVPSTLLADASDVPRTSGTSFFGVDRTAEVVGLGRGARVEEAAADVLNSFAAAAAVCRTTGA